MITYPVRYEYVTDGRMGIIDATDRMVCVTRGQDGLDLAKVLVASLNAAAVPVEVLEQVKAEVKFALDLLTRPKNRYSNGEAAVAALTRALAALMEVSK